MFEVHASLAMAEKGAMPLFTDRDLTKVEERARLIRLRFGDEVVILHRPPVLM